MLGLTIGGEGLGGVTGFDGFLNKIFSGNIYV